MNINKEELISQLNEWSENGEDEIIVKTILAVPEDSIDDELLMYLAESYVNTEEYKKAIAVLEGMRSRRENDYGWQFCMGRALYFASLDEECENDETLRQNILDRAKVSIARTMSMNPPDDILEAADEFSELIEMAIRGEYPDEDAFDGEYGEDEEEESRFGEDVELYDEDEIDAVEEHLQEYFGEFPTVFHEIVSPDIHCDVYVISPTEENNFYTLCTVGMGAHIMSLPDELDPAEFGRAELFITLPPDWKVGENSDEWFWPVGLIKGLARLPIRCDTWLGWGHTVDNQNTFAENTGLCGSVLANPVLHGKDAAECVLPNGDKVNFYQVVPIYREEMEYKIDHRAEELFKLFEEQAISPVVDINRPCVCTDYISRKPAPIDCVSDHSRKIADKNLPLDEINGANHIAIFMRWCIEHNLVAYQFYENCGDVAKGVLDGTNTDIRQFIIDYFDGRLEMYQLSYVGASFCRFYYDWNEDDPDFFYPRDVDSYAESYFGTEKYNSEEFKDEAYLFVPFDEEYYKGMCVYIDKAFEVFYRDFTNYQNSRNEPLFRTAEDMLGCRCILPAEPERLASAYLEATEKKDTFPLLLIIDDDGTVSDEGSLSDMLYDASEPYLTAVTIAEFPCSGIEETTVRLSRIFGSEKPILIESEDIKAADERLFNKFGTAHSAVLSFDEESVRIFISCGGGRYCGFEEPNTAKETE